MKIHNFPTVEKKHTHIHTHTHTHTVREIPEEESGLLSGLGSLMLLGYYIPPTTRNCLDYLSKTRRVMKSESLLITGPSY